MADGVLPMDSTEARKIKKNSSRFTLIDGELYRFGFTHPLLVCVHGEKCVRIMAEVHEAVGATSGVELWQQEPSVQVTTGPQ